MSLAKNNLQNRLWDVAFRPEMWFKYLTFVEMCRHQQAFQSERKSSSYIHIDELFCDLFMFVYETLPIGLAKGEGFNSNASSLRICLEGLTRNLLLGSSTYIMSRSMFDRILKAKASMYSVKWWRNSNFNRISSSMIVSRTVRGDPIASSISSKIWNKSRFIWVYFLLNYDVMI